MFLSFIQREAILKEGNSSVDFGKFHFFTYSRDALYQISKEIGLKAIDEVILPDYICNTVIDVLREFTKNIKTYKINSKLKFQTNEIMQLANTNTKLILFVDYFGVEAEPDNKLITFLHQNNIIIIKDSAHSFLTLVKNDFKCSYRYDYLMSSVYKNIPLYVGAIAVGILTKESKFVDTRILQKRKVVTFIKKLACFLGISLINKKIENMKIVKDKYRPNNGNNCYCSYRSKLENINYQKIISKINILSIEYFKHFKNNSIFSLEEIQKSSLQAFPIWCSSKENRDKILDLMRKNCIDAFTWPTFHETAINKYLWEHILLIPIDIRVLNLIKDKNIDV